MTDCSSKTLSSFATNLKFDDLPESVVRRAEELLLDWFGSTLAGKGARPWRPSNGSQRDGARHG